MGGGEVGKAYSKGRLKTSRHAADLCGRLHVRTRLQASIRTLQTLQNHEQADQVPIKEPRALLLPSPLGRRLWPSTTVIFRVPWPA